VPRTSDTEARLCALRGLGYRIALDNWGLGCTRLLDLAELTPDFVKLPRFLVAGVMKPGGARLVGDFIRVMRELNERPIADHVETRGERDALAALGVRLFVRGGWAGR
jgi:EAL domain-containing protein (putative c-di-GMP-specific phosphodiesterase class I)